MFFLWKFDETVNLKSIKIPLDQKRPQNSKIDFYQNLIRLFINHVIWKGEGGG